MVKVNWRLGAVIAELQLPYMIFMLHFHEENVSKHPENRSKGYRLTTVTRTFYQRRLDLSH